MLVLLQLVGVATVPAKVTVLVPWLVPKLEPVMVTDVPTGPLLGDKVGIPGVTAKLKPLLGKPFTVTTTAGLPKGRLRGTEATTLVSLQPVTVAEAPPIETELVP